MNTPMEALIEFGKIILPAGAVLYAMFLIVRAFLNKELEKKLLELKMKNTELVLPIRLQAYERICLFLERISLNNLIVRLNDVNYSAREFQQVLLREIREEYNHNLSQQVYVTDESWSLAKSAMEEIVMIVNEAAGELGPEARSIDLARLALEKTLERENQAIEFALHHIKEEIRTIY